MKQPFRSRHRGRNNRPFNTVTDLTGEFFSLTTESSLAFMSAAMDLAQRAPTLGLPRQHKVYDCHCDYEDQPPEPERCEIDCQTYVGEHIVTPIRVIDHSRQSLTFNAAAQPWQGAGGDTLSSSIRREQTTFTLGPSQSRILNATLEISERPKPGSSYCTEVTLSSELGQENVCLTVYISAREQSVYEIEQRPRPVSSRRCQHWCDHFYCDRPAFKRGDDGQPERQIPPGGGWR